FMRKDIVGYLDPTKSTLGILLDRDDTQHIEVERIRHALESEKVYRQMGLSVHQLAEHLALPQYRLRNLIHNHMGFRNFNNLLHHYRIAEVCEALEDVGQNTTPVLTLALSAGYQSIAPFNRAFRQQHGLTPTQYRQSKQQ
ncbi:MAG: AraC family transcriptional regulator, partial [Gammaproteobacteria bacterium]|nr:AraC family transcriptional regulator [Gammaproteobacteria bacterium]